jgi:hypothetical protein
VGVTEIVARGAGQLRWVGRRRDRAAGTMGFGLLAAIGAQVARPDATVCLPMFGPAGAARATIGYTNP